MDVVGLASGVAAVAAGGDHTCALTAAGGVKCWGDNGYGQLGDGTTTDIASRRWTWSGWRAGSTAVAAGEYHTCALTAAGGVKCWGDNVYGQLGDGTTTGPPHAGGRGRAGERGGGRGGRRVSHLCADGGGRGQVLGVQRLRPVGRRHDDRTRSRRWTWSGWRAGWLLWRPAMVTPVR